MAGVWVREMTRGNGKSRTIPTLSQRKTPQVLLNRLDTGDKDFQTWGRGLGGRGVVGLGEVTQPRERESFYFLPEFSQTST